jgi:hypothetical protein
MGASSGSRNQQHGESGANSTCPSDVWISRATFDGTALVKRRSQFFIVSLLVIWRIFRPRRASSSQINQSRGAERPSKCGASYQLRYSETSYECHRPKGHPGPHHGKAISGEDYYEAALAWSASQRMIKERRRHYADCPDRSYLSAVIILIIPWGWIVSIHGVE